MIQGNGKLCVSSLAIVDVSNIIEFVRHCCHLVIVDSWSVAQYVFAIKVVYKNNYSVEAAHRRISPTL